MATIYTTLDTGSEAVIDWQRAFDTYFTSGKMKDNTAVNKFGKEKSANYTLRKCNVAADNTYDTDVNNQVEKVFAEGKIARPTLNEKSDEYNKEIDTIAQDIDKGGTDINAFFEWNSKLSRVMGTTLLIADNEKASKLPENAENIGRNDLPFGTIYSPLDLSVYGKTETGSLVYVKFPIEEDDINAFQTPVNNINASQKYRVYRRNRGRIEIYDTTMSGSPDITKSGDGDDGTEQIIRDNLKNWPIVECRTNIPEKKWLFANSKDRKIHSAEALILNMQSFHNEILKNNTFPIWVENVGTKPQKSGQTKSSGVNVGVSYGVGLNAPQWVTPPSDAVEALFESVDRIRKQILVNMNASSAVDDGASSDTRKMADEQKVEQNKRTASMSEIWEMMFMNIALKAFLTGTTYVYKVLYNKKFAFMSGDLLLEEVETKIRLNNAVGLPNNINYMLLKALYQKLDPNDTDLLDAISEAESEIKTNTLENVDADGNVIDDIKDEE